MHVPYSASPVQWGTPSSAFILPHGITATGRKSAPNGVSEPVPSSRTCVIPHRSYVLAPGSLGLGPSQRPARYS